MKEQNDQSSWFTSVLDQHEAELAANGVPSCYWSYILANGAPGTRRHDGFCAIYIKRESLVSRLLEIPNSSDMGVVVVDGRDLQTIREWIGGVDWTEDVANSWSRLMALVGVENLSVQTK